MARIACLLGTFLGPAKAYAWRFKNLVKLNKAGKRFVNLFDIYRLDRLLNSFASLRQPLRALNKLKSLLGFVIWFGCVSSVWWKWSIYGWLVHNTTCLRWENSGFLTLSFSSRWCRTVPLQGFQIIYGLSFANLLRSGISKRIYFFRQFFDKFRNLSNKGLVQIRLFGFHLQTVMGL